MQLLNYIGNAQKMRFPRQQQSTEDIVILLPTIFYAFPDDVDADKDQTVYYIMETDEYAHRTPVDGKEYEQWCESYRNGAGTVTVPYLALAEENILMLR